jgi:hypothetical protein
MKKILSVIVVAALAWVAVHRVEVALEARELVDMAKAALRPSATADDLREARAAAARRQSCLRRRRSVRRPLRRRRRV